MAETSEITLRALSGVPLADARVAQTIVATAHAIGERTGVAVLGVTNGPDHVTVALGVNRLAAIGFAAELRRLTERWYGGKHAGATLWGRADEAEAPGDYDPTI